MPKSTRVVAVLGPTASGKSALAEILADHTSAELINSDASAVYSELSVGVTKPDETTRRRYHYHLLDVTTLEQGFDLMRYLELANAALAEVTARGNMPVVVGGSGLYARALLDGYDPPQVEVGRELRERVRALEAEEACRALAAIDPAAWERIDRKNPRRVQRALELAWTAGGPVEPPGRSGRPDLDVLKFCLLPSSELLQRRIEQRTHAMWPGWTEEVLYLEKKGLGHWLEVRKPIGYDSVLAYHRGELSQAEAIERIVHQTKKLAKKQRTWLKREAESKFSHRLVYNCDEQWGEISESALRLLREFLATGDSEGKR